MGKAWSNLSSTLKMAVVIFALGLGVVVYLGGDSASPAKTTKKLATKPTSANGNSDLTPEDYTATAASFPLVKPGEKDAFKPLVMLANAGGSTTSDKQNGVPPYMVDGDSNWIYTGTAELDDVPTVLLENTSTNDGIFLKQGQRWKQLVVEQITPDSVIVKGDDGQATTLHLAAPTEEDVKPVTPDATALQGPIGANGPWQGAAAAQDPNMTVGPNVVIAPQGGWGGGRGFGGGRGGGRRGGGGRGGGGFGPGGFNPGGG